MASRAKFIIGWVPALIWCASIYWLSSRSQVEPPRFWLPPHFDKLVHFVLYAILGLLFHFAMIRGRLSAIASSIISVLLAAMYGITDEIHQMHVPGRNADLADWLADAGGALFSAWLWNKYISLRSLSKAKRIPK